jgi:hypothetical protein
MPPSAAGAAQMLLSNVGVWEIVAGRLGPLTAEPQLHSNVLPDAVERLLAESGEALQRRTARGLVLPAGALRAQSLPLLCEQAHRLAARANALGIDLLFAGDVRTSADWAPLLPTRESYVFGFSQGQFRIACAPRITAPHRIRAHHLRGRVMLLGGKRVCAILATEVFSKGLREAVAALDVDAMIVLSHHAPTHRWDAPLRLLADAAPTVVVCATHKPVPVDHEERGWAHTRLVQSPEVCVDSLLLARR